MWTHLFEVILTGIGLFVGPLMIVAAMGGALAVLDRFINFTREPHRTHASSRSL